MLTTAIFGLLNRNQMFYASKMTQLVASDVKRAYDSDWSFSDDEQDFVGISHVNKKIFTE